METEPTILETIGWVQCLWVSTVFTVSWTCLWFHLRIRDLEKRSDDEGDGR